MVDNLMLQKDTIKVSLSDLEICREISSAFTYMLTKNDINNVGAIISLNIDCMLISSIVANSINCKYVIPIRPVHFTYSEYKLEWEYYSCLNNIENGVVLITDIIDDYKELQNKLKPIEYFKKKGSFEQLCVLCIKFDLNRDIGTPVLSLIEKRD